MYNHLFQYLKLTKKMIQTNMKRGDILLNTVDMVNLRKGNFGFHLIQRS